MESNDILNQRIAILEDSPEAGISMVSILRSSGFEPQLITSGNEFLRAIEADHFALYILDWGIPDLSGIDVLRALRKNGIDQVPVIFVTARSEELDIAVALNEGADDFIVKPFSQAVLLARVKAVLRRAASVKNVPDSLDIPPFRIVRHNNQVTQNGIVCELTDKEFRLVWMLFSELGAILTRQRIVESVWGLSMSPDARTLDTHIYRLRKKLSISSENGLRLVTVHKIGYRLEQL